MSEPEIIQLPVGMFIVNTYIVVCPKTGEAVVIDPAGDEAMLAETIRERGCTPRYILNTHGHLDHLAGNRDLAELLGVPCAMHRADNEFFQSEDGVRAAEKELGLFAPDPADVELEDGQVIEVGTLRIEVVHTPGHTPGSVCYRVGDNLFTGDTLFVGAAGRTDLTGGDLMTLVESVKTRIATLPDHTVIWPGHDYGDTPTSTVGREKEENPFITDF
ncbi:MAG: MBL fold metallo-hydrolase [Desulfatibacillaceae bacterium]